MTVIVGMHTPQGTWMAADGRTIYGDGSVCRDNTLKLARHGDWCLGLAGQSRGLYLVQRNLAAILAYDLDHGELADAVEAIGIRIRDVLIADGWTAAKVDGEGPKFDLSYLLGHPGGLWTVGRDFSPDPIPFESRGSGMDYAMGAMAALQDSGLPPAEILRRAVRVATRCDSRCGGEPHVEELVAQQEDLATGVRAVNPHEWAPSPWSASGG